eukprot:4986196-Heterocapsa_arctica.AAC.1
MSKGVRRRRAVLTTRGRPARVIRRWGASAPANLGARSRSEARSPAGGPILPPCWRPAGETIWGGAGALQ